MIFKECNTVIASTIDELWRESMLLCIQNGKDFLVKGGSYVGQIRKQLPFFVGCIKTPWVLPLAPITPPGIPPTTSDDKIESYFLRYLVGIDVAENEVYTYGTFIVPQLDRCIYLLNESNGNTNQASITVGDTEVCQLSDPPCLRNISFKVVDGQLQMSVYFRSWDLYAGLPENLGGLQLLKEYVLSHLLFPVIDGPLIAYSDGLHLYSQYFDCADTLNATKVTVDASALADKELYEMENGK